MCEQEIKNKLQNIIQSSVSVIYSDIVVTEECHLVDDLGFDSITLMQLIIEIEEAFNIEMSDAQYEEIVNIVKLTKYIKEKIERGNEINDDGNL